MLAPYLQPPYWGNHLPKAWPSYHLIVDELRTDAIDVPDGGWAPHLRTGLYALLLTLAAGFAVLLGWVLLGGFGIVLGLVAAGIGLAWSRQREGAVIPRDVRGGAMLRVLLVAVVLAGIAFLVNRG
jgi:hypothetical protein